MSVQHFLYSPETAYGTWVTPAKALPVNTADFGTAREVIDFRTSGSGRGLYLRTLGAKPVTGTLELPFWNAYVASILKTFLRDAATSGSSPYTHGFAPDDTQNFLGISVQTVHKSGAVYNYLSNVVSTFTIRAATKEPATLSFAFESKDEARAGENWDYSGSSSPSAVANPGTLYPSIARPLIFYDAEVRIDGTPSWNNTTTVISVSGDTAYAKILNVEIACAFNLDTDGYGLTDDPTRQEIIPGNRDITVSFEISWSDYATTFYDAARAGTAMSLELNLVASASQAAHVVVPSLFFDPNRLPPVSGDSAKRTLSLTGKAQYDSTTGKDFNIWLVNSESSI